MSSKQPAVRWGLCALTLAVVAVGACAGFGAGPFGLLAFALLALTGMVVADAPAARLRAERALSPDGTPQGFTLAYRTEVVRLEPKRAWQQVDRFKWVTRGVIGEPQSIHVHADGSVDINGETILVGDPSGAAKLEAEINKRHVAAPVEKPMATVKKESAPAPDRSVFHLRLDHLGHLHIECQHGGEKAETGLRGLPMLVQNGLMLPPRDLHLDPLQQYVELDGTRYDITPDGVPALEAALNSHYAPKLAGAGGVAVEIKENPGSATGFDIHFVTIRAGAKFEVKGHLSQENLDILQDQAKCDLLRPGIVLKLSPPYLLIRRRRSDGGDEPIPDLPDLRYRSVNAAQLQAVFNHPLLRRGDPAATTAGESPDETADLIRLCVTRNPDNRRLLWLEGHTTAGDAPWGRALTHHNLADLQKAGVFRPEMDVVLSLDNRTLSILNQTNHDEQTLTLEAASDDRQLVIAGELLTAALRPARPSAPKAQTKQKPTPPPVAEPPPPPPPPPPVLAPKPPPPVHRATPLPEPTKTWDTAAITRPPVAAPPPLIEPEPPEMAWFDEAEGRQVTEEVFRRLGPFFCLPIRSVRLSLPHVFADRLFEVISFEDQEVETLFDLRGEEFYGFYRAHLNEHHAVLVYACKGLHVEFGPERCLVELARGAEPHEFKGAALLGFAQNVEHHEVFVVTPAFKTWIKPHERTCEAGFARFITPREFAAGRDQYHLVWPERS